MRRIVPICAPLVAALLWPALLGGCSSGSSSTPATDPEPMPAPVEEEAQLAQSDPDSIEVEALPADENLLTKILRTHPQLATLEELYTRGGELYAARDLELSEQHFFLLMQGLEQVAEAPQDSLALLYLSSLDRKLGYFVDLLEEERFFSDRYAPVEMTLADTFDSLRVRYGIPEFLLPATAEPDQGSLAALLEVENDRVDYWMNYFQRNGRTQFQKWLERRARYGPYIQSILVEEEMPTELLSLAMIESGLQSTIRSRAGAVGWWQFMRSTARNRGLQVDEWVDERRDIDAATRAACRHLALLHRMFQDWALAFAAYNAGEYRIQRAIGLSGNSDYWELRLPRETRGYVPKFIAASRIATNPKKYGFKAGSADSLKFETITLDDAYSMDQVAKATAISLSQLRQLNPQLLAAVTPPGRDDYELRVPVGKGEAAQTALTNIPEDERITWRKHRVRSGQTLGAISRRYNTSVAAIMQLNGITNARRVRAGRVLTIPYPRGVDAPTQVASAQSSRNSESYRVRRGDTLASISRKTRVSQAQLRRLNSIQGDRINAGQTLTLREPPPPAVPIDEQTHERVRYTVRKGDTLHAISQSHGVTLTELLSWNRLSSRSKIFPGDQLDIWTPR